MLCEFMNVFCHIPRENWFADRFGKEFGEHSQHNVSFTHLSVDIIWLLAPWCWKQIPYQSLVDKKVICTIHHEVPDKFDDIRLHEFLSRDAIVDVYHVPCKQTKYFIEQYTKKPIHVLGYWVNNKIWYSRDQTMCRKQLSLPEGKFFVGSFQRDTEGADLITPKLEKGPDKFCDYVEQLHAIRGDVHVLLNGWRRQYVINRLSLAGIPYTYNELPDFNTVAMMYAACDLYVVGSRYEGGPQAVLEAPAMNVPIISTDVGMAADILPSTCIMDVGNSNVYYPSLSDVTTAHVNVQRYYVDTHVKHYDDLFRMI